MAATTSRTKPQPPHPGIRGSRARTPEIRRSKTPAPGIRCNTARTPATRRNRTRTPGIRRSKARTPGIRHNRTRTPGIRHNRTRTPGIRRNRTRTPGIRRNSARKRSQASAAGGWVAATSRPARSTAPGPHSGRAVRRATPGAAGTAELSRLRIGLCHGGRPARTQAVCATGVTGSHTLFPQQTNR
ncbi:hypothetical protein GCM10025331_25590 [Actinoplanes utahensis]